MKRWFAVGGVFLAILSIGLAAAQYAPQTLMPGRTTVIDAGFFGIHFHRLKLMPGEKGIDTVWPALNFGMLRLWDSRTRWADIEPARGDWRFERLDFYVDQAFERGARILFTLGSTPRWASARPDEPCSYGKGCSAEPASLEYWREYVRVMARRYKGRICCYEVWNEPDFSGSPKAGFYTGSVETLVEMSRIAKQVLQEEDPDALLFSPAFVNGPRHRLNKFLAAGGREHVQGIAYHFYAWDDERRMLREIEQVRAVMKANGLAHLPLWSTEAGVEVVAPDQPLPSGIKQYITRQEAAAMMVRQIVLVAFAGVEKYFYYAWDSDTFGMVDRAGQAYPSRDAMLLVQRWLRGATLDRCELRNPGPTVCWIEKDKQRLAIVWNPDSAESLEIPVPTGMRIDSRQSAVPAWTPDKSVAVRSDVMLASPNPTLYAFERVAAK